MLRPSSPLVQNGLALAAIACLVALLWPSRADAAVVVYEAVVPVAGNTEADRTAAMSAALRTAAVRASGQRDAASNPVIASAAANPARYVQRYSRTQDRQLKVGFDAAAMDRLMQQAGLPLWPLERPVTLVLLATPAIAGGSRALVEGDVSPVKSEFERAADARGLPIVWPRQPVDVERIRAIVAGGGVDDGMAPEGAQAVLAGYGGEGPLSWRFTEAGRSSRAEGSLQAGADFAADELAARYALASSRGTSTISVRIGGIHDIRAYAGMLDYLQSLSFMRELAVKELNGGVVTLDLTLRGDAELLRRIGALDGRLMAGGTNGAETTDRADFTYQP